MDVHPPLAKLLITLFGWLAGFNGDFDFKEIGMDYVEPRVPYVAMRMFPAICGVLLVPTMFLTLKAAGCRTFTAAMGAGLVIFGESYSVQSRGAGANSSTRREWFTHTSSPDSARFPPRSGHGLYGHGFHVLHKPTRIGAYQGFPGKLVVLARHDGSRSGYHDQHQMGWPLHDCLGRILDSHSALGSAWRLQDRHDGEFTRKHPMESISD